MITAILVSLFSGSGISALMVKRFLGRKIEKLSYLEKEFDLYKKLTNERIKAIEINICFNQKCDNRIKE